MTLKYDPGSAGVAQARAMLLARARQAARAHNNLPMPSIAVLILSAEINAENARAAEEKIEGLRAEACQFRAVADERWIAINAMLDQAAIAEVAADRKRAESERHGG